MGKAKEPRSVELFSGLIGISESALELARRSLSEKYGPIEEVSKIFSFDFTNYYQDEMGPDLLRQFVAFENTIDPAILSRVKLSTNSLEDELTQELDTEVERGINIDPGYLELSKVVLATTKNYSHRVYLRDGIYAEVTLHYEDGTFQPYPWTYPDYCSEGYINYFNEIRRNYKDKIPP